MESVNIHFCALLLVILAITTTADLEPESRPEIKTPSGLLRGKYLQARDGRTFAAFLGVPFAEPPKRFQAPKYVKSWEGVREATEFGSRCLQYDFLFNRASGSEDCLYLNVYTPDVAGNFAVMVSIHGGAFSFGSADQYGAKYYMNENVVLVTINYRVGSLGFLSTGDNVIPGNFGLKDQNIALRWVQGNIKAFGGDKNRVTIFGVSAGAGSVAHHILSPMSKGLFHKAISQSGSALNPWCLVQNPRAAANEMAERLGCPTDESLKLAQCLLKKTPDEIMQGQNLTKWHFDPITPFGPVKEFSFDDTFLDESPLKLLQEGRFNKVPWIVTVTKDEGQSLHAAHVVFHDKLRNEINEDWPKIAPLTFQYDGLNLSKETKNLISEEIKKFYLNNEKIDKSAQQNLSDLYSDRLFLYGIQKAVLLHAKYSPAYAGLFAFKGAPGILDFFGLSGNEDVVTHGDDIKFHYNFEGMGETEKGSAQEVVSKMLVKLWVTFASSSSHEPELEVNGVPWPKVSLAEIKKSSLNWLVLDDKPHILKGTFDKRMKFWDDILSKHVKPNINSSKEEL